MFRTRVYEGLTRIHIIQMKDQTDHVGDNNEPKAIQNTAGPERDP